MGFFKYYSFLKYVIHAIIFAFGNSGTYVSRSKELYLIHNTYTGPMIGKRANPTPTQGLVLKNYIHFHGKSDSFNLIPQILSEKFIIHLKIKSFFTPRTSDTDILSF